MSKVQRQYIDMNTLMTRIRQRIMERGAQGIRGIARLFLIADDNRDKKVDVKNELPKVMNDCGIILNKTELTELARLLDKNGDGLVSYDEFLFQMAPPMNDTRIAIVNQAFDKLDKDGSGRVTIADLEMAHNADTSELVRLGKTTAKAVFDNLIASYSHDDDKTITRSEFIDYYREISPSFDLDEAFIEMMKNAWKL